MEDKEIKKRLEEETGREENEGKMTENKNKSNNCVLIPYLHSSAFSSYDITHCLCLKRRQWISLVIKISHVILGAGIAQYNH